jgi:hypothetical protein
VDPLERSASLSITRTEATHSVNGLSIPNGLQGPSKGINNEIWVIPAGMLIPLTDSLI